MRAVGGSQWCQRRAQGDHAATKPSASGNGAACRALVSGARARVTVRKSWGLTTRAPPPPSAPVAALPQWGSARPDDDEVPLDYFEEAPSPSALGLGGGAGSLSALAANLEAVADTNALQTALAAAIRIQDFKLAAAVRDRLAALAAEGGEGGGKGARIDWASTGMPPWLLDRAERLGFRFPTEVQRRSAPVLLAGSDAVVASETGSGKTLSFLLPLLARLSYPPELFMDDMKAPQALVVVPTMELGVQVALMAYKLLGGNMSTGRPGDEANMFTYFGPKGIKVRGVLNKEEVVMAKGSLTYLNQVHLVVGTPAAIMEAASEPDPAPLLRGLKVLAIDEVDECFSAFPEDTVALLEAVAGPGAAEGNPFGTKPQVIFVGATQRQDVLTHAVGSGWLREPVSIQVGRENTVPPALLHRYIVVDPSRRLAALARSLRADLAEADQDAAPARVMLFVNTPAEAAAVAEPLRSSLWAEHRMALLVPPGTILGPDDDDVPPPSFSAPSSSAPSSPSSASPAGAGDLSPATIAAGRRGHRRGDYSSLRSSSPAAASGAASDGAPGGADGGTLSPEEEAAAAAAALDDMFSYSPIRALHSFRDNKSSLLLATAGAARGLDLPGVSHVYSLGPPVDATGYLHRAGRAGRIGSTAGGIVTTIVTPEELPALLAIGEELGIALVQEEEATGELVGTLPRLEAPPDEGESADQEASGGGPEGASSGLGAQLGDVDKLRKGLEDLYNLM
ncbi:hypothetical protein HYH03_004284 [Edaphochlamys debaryana]|uniref:RNA helicase n=1 Tax=Edaphochlamys debaryana TaxID=47281 RepID=A0A835Y743_9CHLO|nr:hypothetical protein HYH03_004284 [Edaphochlamys debaryana]|eukprot:KAG2497537.1 hypothetical protein HYH03_004284 [Edaphochlamys debaryana]